MLSPRTRRQIVVTATEIPVITGTNKHRHVEDVFLTVWKRTNPRQFRAAQSALELQQNESMEQKMYNSTYRTKRHDCNGVFQDLVQFHLQRYPPQLQVKRKQPVFYNPSKAIRTHLSGGNAIYHSKDNKLFGKLNEKPALDMYRNIFDRSITANSESNYRQRLFEQDPDGSFCSDVLVTGKIDGFTLDGKIIEVKSRTKRLFEHLFLHEYIQIQAYLWICEKYEGQFVQYLPHKQEMKTQKIQFDHNYWNEKITPRLRTFGTSLDLFMRDTNLQKLYLQYPHMRKDIIWSLYMHIASN